jgi:hypothetical protein
LVFFCRRSWTLVSGTGVSPSDVVAVAAVVVLLVPVFSFFAAFVSALADFAVVFASALAVLVAGDVVFVLPVALAVVAFGPPFVVFAPAVVVFGPAFVVFGDEVFVVVPFDDTCGFGVDPLLPCAGTVTVEASTNATAARSVVIVRVMNPPMGHSPNRMMRCKRHSSWTM